MYLCYSLYQAVHCSETVTLRKIFSKYTNMQNGRFEVFRKFENHVIITKSTNWLLFSVICTVFEIRCDQNRFSVHSPILEKSVLYVIIFPHSIFSFFVFFKFITRWSPILSFIFKFVINYSSEDMTKSSILVRRGCLEYRKVDSTARWRQIMTSSSIRRQCSDVIGGHSKEN